jgi:hypothetical protein
MNICITSVGVRGHYPLYLDRLQASLKKHDNNIPRLFFRNCWPPGSPPHQDKHYAFKNYAMQAVQKAGFDVGIWLDSACEVLAPLEPILETIAKTGYYIVAGDEPLGEWISDQAIAHFNTMRDHAMSLKLCGGAIVALDFRTPIGKSFMWEWNELAKGDLFFTSHSELAPDKMTSLMVSDGPKKVIVSKDSRFKGHRSDEACFSLMLNRRGVEPMDVKDLMCTREFPNPMAVLKSGYDL